MKETSHPECVILPKASLNSIVLKNYMRLIVAFYQVSLIIVKQILTDRTHKGRILTNVMGKDQCNHDSRNLREDMHRDRYGELLKDQ